MMQSVFLGLIVFCANCKR